MEGELPNEPRLDAPDADAVYFNYLATCRRLGVEPMPGKRARELVGEWTATSGEAMRREYINGAYIDARS